MLTITNVNKYFNRHKKNEIHVINNTSLTLADNGLVALLGPSGCGKTTLLNCIGGLDSIKNGSIYINDQKISSRCANKVDKIRNLNVGYIFQDYKLIDNKTVFDNVALVLTMLGIKDKKEIKERVEFVLDKVGMLRYKRRPAAMLSGGERQRVGIARALVKNPNIILADEPTGNLDSKNSLEIMRIIKAISKDRLVILVTHEQNLAHFYADRIVEITDGQVTKDYSNTDVDELDYEVDNTFYLKDLDKCSTNKNSNEINIYTDSTSEPIKLDIVVNKGNIYIRSNTNDTIEVIDDNSSIEFVDAHYQKINKEELDKYEFNLKDVINPNRKLKYASIFNPITLITNGFKKIFDLSIIKKILLAGFVLSGGFIMYAVASISAAITVKDADFITYNKNYLTIKQNKIDVSKYMEYNTSDKFDYILPGKSKVTFTVNYNFFYQTYDAQDDLEGSLASIDLITKDNLIYGRMPEDNHEIVIDKMVFERLRKESPSSKMAGITDIKDFLDLDASIGNVSKFKIVGISDLESPSIYAYDNMLVPIIFMDKYKELDVNKVYYKDLFDAADITLKEGRNPVNDYEVIVNIEHKEEYKLNKKIDTKVNGTKLTVVGYYDSRKNIDLYITNTNTALYQLVKDSQDITVYSKDKLSALNYIEEELKLNVNDSYELSRSEYMEDKREGIRGALIVSGIILIISLIEIFLMIRSSFLSRIKEVGIYRAIGVKKLDIYKMFFGEIFAITTISSIPGLIFSAYVLYKLSSISILSNYYMINPFIIIVSIIFVYLFNLVIGLLPVYNTMRKRPANILSRQDLD